MSYRICIPSYQREEVLRDKTLALLKAKNISNELIDVFVSDKEQYKSYKQVLDEDYYGNLIIAEKGISQVHNKITQHYPENTPLFHLDDDVTDILVLKGKQLVPWNNSLNKLIMYGFKLMNKYNSDLLGVYPVKNHYFMSHTLNKGLYFCIGQCFWNINHHNIKLHTSCKEDYERSLEYYLKYGNVLRFNNIVCDSKMYCKGGMETVYEDYNESVKSGKYLINKYPNYVRENKKREARFEVSFIKQQNNTKIKL